MKYLISRLLVFVFLITFSIGHTTTLTPDEKSTLEKDRVEDSFWFAGKHTLKVVQNRYFKKEKTIELTLLSGGYFLKNQYIDIYSIGGAVTYYLNEMWGWEIISASFTSTKERAEIEALKKFTEEKFGVAVTADIRKPKHFFTSNILWSPVYGKFSLLESRFIYYDTYFLIGGGIVRLNAETKPVFNIGFGQKYFITKGWATKIDLKQYYYKDTIYNQEGIRDKIVLTLGISYAF